MAVYGGRSELRSPWSKTPATCGRFVVPNAEGFAAKIVTEGGAAGNYSASQLGNAILENPVAARAYTNLQKQGFDVRLYRAADGLAGTTNELGVHINMAYNSTVDDALSTLVHESKHVDLWANTGNFYGLRGARAGEYSALSLEFFFQNGRRPTALERANIQREIVGLGY